ncbi:hypothetical protein IAD21_01644 [Abditibacteriota bacterium]|nr:hypothetical protein IAD21_01644 [Abditibacteriota bacterium]
MKVLYSPLGLSYGTLYSAILLTRPDRIVIVTSAEAINALGTTLDAARFYHSGFEFETHVLNDPLAGFSEGRLLTRFLAASSGEENIVNLSGGTAAMQDCVASLAALLRREGKPVREVAAIDRRDFLEQRRSPLVVGELVEVPPAI